MITMGDYQAEASKTATYRESIRQVISDQVSTRNSLAVESCMRIQYTLAGLISEVGEVADILKKAMRDEGVLDYGSEPEIVGNRVANELGDVLWYVAMLADELDLPLDEIAEMNLRKLASRANRGVIGGSGDER